MVFVDMQDLFMFCEVSTVRRMLGLILILITVCLWTPSNFLASVSVARGARLVSVAERER